MEYDYSLLKSCGDDVYISSNVEIKRPHLVEIGNHVAIDSGFYCTTRLQIGDYVHIGAYCSITGGENGLCVLNDFCGLSAGCRVLCASDDYLGSGLTNPTIPRQYRANVITEPVILYKHVVLGTNCVVLPGVSIEEGVAVGSCSMVKGTLYSWGVYAGIPAKWLKVRERSKILELETRLRNEFG